MEEELISIVIPIFNTELSALNCCLECIQKQIYKNIEVICVDGGSNHNVIQTIKNYLIDCRFILIRTSPGVSHQRNIGIDNSRGRFIIFIDSDDYFDSNYVNNLYLGIKESNADVAIPLTHRCIFSNGILESETAYNIEQVNERINKDNFFKYARYGGLVEVGKMYKAKAIENMEFIENCSYGEDMLFNYELSKKGYNACLVRNAIYNYRVLKGSNSASRRLCNKNGYYIIKKLASIIRSKEIKDKESLKGLYKDFDFVFNSFYYALAREKKIFRLIWMIQFKGLYLRNHHNLHDILYMFFPIFIVGRRNRKTKKMNNNSEI